MMGDTGRVPSGRAGGPTDLSRDASQPKALIPNAEAFHPSEYILDAMNERGWSRDDLAREMGGDVPLNTLALDFYFEVGPTEPSLRIGEIAAQQLSRALEVSTRYLLNLEAAWLAAQSERTGA